MQVRGKANPTAIYAVITADVVGSRRIAGFRKKRDSVLRAVSDAQAQQGLLLSPYTITVWDEFQAIMAAPDKFPRAVLDLRRQFYPMQLRIAIGIGEVTEPRKMPLNQFAGGAAFERARAAMDRIKVAKGNLQAAWTAVESGDSLLDLAANAIYLLQDTLTSDLSAAQWKTSGLVAQLGSQEKAARKLRVNISTVSRALRRAHHRELEESTESLAMFVRERFSLAQ